MSHFFRFCYISLLFWMLTESLSLRGWEWYSSEVNFSDWRGKPCEYSTNAVVTDWYNKGQSKYFRAENMDEIRARLDRGDTLTLGLDYYALFSISGRFLPRPSDETITRLRSGEVIVIELVK